MKTRHAVLFYPDRPFPNTAIMWIDGKSFHCEELPDPCYTLHDLAEVAYKRYVTHLWVMPSYGEFDAIKGMGEWSFSTHTPKRRGMATASAWKRGHKDKDVELIFMQNTSWWGTDKAKGWMQDADAHEVLIALHYLEKALGITIGGSPGRAGWNYLKTLHPEWVEEVPGVTLAQCHFDKTIAFDIIWQRVLLSAERAGKKYIHKFDKGAAYPYAGTQTDVGVGTPLHIPFADVAAMHAVHEKGHPQAVGTWRCSIKYDGSKYNPTMPPVWKEEKGTYAGSEGWLAGPIIRLLRSQGHEVTIHEGWVFPEKHDVLVKWGKNLWNIRQGFDLPTWVNKKCAKLAKQATKQIMNTTIGLTMFKDFEDDDDMKRPDIREQVIARHRELTWHNIEKIRRMYGVTPVLVYMDAVYYVSSNPNGRAFLPELVKREGQFGGYRWEGAIELTPDVMKMLDAKRGEAERLEFLNSKGWVK